MSVSMSEKEKIKIAKLITIGRDDDNKGDNQPSIDNEVFDNNINAIVNVFRAEGIDEMIIPYEGGGDSGGIDSPAIQFVFTDDEVIDTKAVSVNGMQSAERIYMSNEKIEYVIDDSVPDELKAKYEAILASYLGSSQRDYYLYGIQCLNPVNLKEAQNLLFDGVMGATHQNGFWNDDGGCGNIHLDVAENTLMVGHENFISEREYVSINMIDKLLSSADSAESTDHELADGELIISFNCESIEDSLNAITQMKLSEMEEPGSPINDISFIGEPGKKEKMLELLKKAVAISTASDSSIADQVNMSRTHDNDCYDYSLSLKITHTLKDKEPRAKLTASYAYTDSEAYEYEFSDRIKEESSLALRPSN